MREAPGRPQAHANSDGRRRRPDGGPSVNKFGDWFIPNGDQNAWRWIDNQTRLANRYAELLPASRRGTVVQAGGNIGVYPIAFAHRFERVVCFEASPVIFECLTANTNSDVLCPQDIRNRMLICNAALGAQEDNVAVNYNTEHCGASFIEKCHRAEDAVQMIPLDRIRFRACDLIQLDVEGYELPALIGATATIAQHRPLIILELLKHGERYGYTRQDLLDHMRKLDYSCRDLCGLTTYDDFLFTPNERATK
jgi:FkbM family methyltransferase